MTKDILQLSTKVNIPTNNDEVINSSVESSVDKQDEVSVYMFVFLRKVRFKWP